MKRHPSLNLSKYAALVIEQTQQINAAIDGGLPVTSLNTFKGYPVSFLNGYKKMEDHVFKENYAV